MRPLMKSIGELERDGAIAAIQDGNHGGSHPKSMEFVKVGVPFLMASDINGDGHIDFEGCARLSRERADRLRIGFARTDDVLLTHKGTVGRVALLGQIDPYVMLTPQVTYYRLNNDLLLPRFLVQALRSSIVQQQLASQSAQSTRPYISISSQRHIGLPWFPLHVQRQIADILSAYDDLIEVNTRRIAILEEMARRVFDEWFVRFRFPGHITAQTLQPPAGPLPNLWELGTVASLAEYINRGIAPKYDDDAETIVVNQKCIRDGRLNLRLARRQSCVASPDKIIQRFDVLINSTGVGTLGRVSQAMAVPLGSTADTHVTIVRCRKDVDPYFFGVQLTVLQGQFERAGIGSTGQTELSRSAINETPLVIPPKSLRDRFGKLVGPMRDLAETLSMQNEALRATRDLLLPKLISGEIDVERAERGTEVVAKRAAAE